MVAALASALLVLVTAQGAPASPVAVVRAPRGEVVVVGPRDSVQNAVSGVMVRMGDAIEVGHAGWCELHAFEDVRLRLSSATRLVFTAQERGTDVEIRGGRAWISVPLSGRPLTASVGRFLATIDPGTASVFAHNRVKGLHLAVRTGRVVIRDADRGLVEVKEGEAIQIVPTSDKFRRPSMGGEGLVRLVVQEASRQLGDLAGIEPFLIRRVARATVSRAATRPFSRLHIGDESRGSENGPVGVVLERALRPPPFFATEVPPKGPNVRVEVRFDEE